MGLHEDFRELCAAATAGELNATEQARLDAHLAGCADCRQVMSEYETITRVGLPALIEDSIAKERSTDGSWSVEDAEKAFFKRLDREEGGQESERVSSGDSHQTKVGKRFTYRPSQIRWREIWMPFAAAVLLALALGIAAYRTGVERGTDVARIAPATAKEPRSSLEEQSSDAGYQRSQVLAKLAADSQVIDDLKRQLAEQIKTVNSLRSTDTAIARTPGNSQPDPQRANDAGPGRDEVLAAAQAKLAELQKTTEAATAERDQNARQAAVLEAKVGELAQLLRDREQALDREHAEIAKDQELLEHDRDIRELMGARQLYMADVRDVSGTGTDKTYGRLFYTKGKSLIFYAFDLDAHPGVQNASSFQAWGRRGPDKEQALNLGIFYEDNVSKKRWVLKADDPKTLQDIDAVFVTVEPNGGSHHPSGKQLLFAHLRVSPNYP